jgi:nitrate reductase gamma subunit
MPLAGYVVAYIGIGIFVIAVIARIVMWSSLPMHLRWELYPVPHERGDRASYGGSYLEEVDWWKKPRRVSLWGELRVMVLEILFLAALREHNPKMWIRSFPFHFGLYLVIACTALMMVAGLLGALWPSILAGGLGAAVRYGTAATGWAGLVLGLAGALGLLQRRLGAEELRDYTTPADIFNLLFFVVAFGCALLTAIAVDRDFARVSAIVHGLVTLGMPASSGAGVETLLPTISVILLGALVAYIPLTHMSHFIGKYFAYHAIRWNDRPNLRGGAEEPVIARQLARKVSWAASHIKGDGQKSWADVATESQSPPAAADGEANK